MFVMGMLGILVLVGYWAVLTYQLSPQWWIYPQYAYGWAVPMLCGCLAWRRLTRMSPEQPMAGQGLQAQRGFRAPTQSAAADTPALAPDRGTARSWKEQQWSTWARRVLALGVLGFASAYLVTRWLHEANPIWRLTSWALALEVIVVTLLVLGVWAGRTRSAMAMQLVFPVCFFLVAVPWPTPVEHLVVQTLTRANAASVVEILGWIGIPAIQKGNAIEVATGSVGLEAACSGIRSLQATFMVSLFLGELYQLSARRRLALVVSGTAAAFLCNVSRTGVLVWVTARSGTGAISGWHDATGVGALMVCFLGVSVMACCFKRGNILPAASSSVAGPGSRLEGQGASSNRRDESPRLMATRRLWVASAVTAPRWLLCFLLAWLFVTEAVVAAWYRFHESPHRPPLEWTVSWPVQNQTFQDSAMPKSVHQMLRFDTGRMGFWTEADGTEWHMFHLRWLPSRSLNSRARVQLAKSHRPEACLPAAGFRLKSEFAPCLIDVGQGLRLPFRRYEFEISGRTVFVFFSVTEQGGPSAALANPRWDHRQRFLAALQGARNYGQTTLEIAVSGFSSIDDAQEALAQRARTLIKLEPAGRARRG